MDKSYGQDGTVVLSLGQAEVPRTACLSHDGEILVAGKYANNNMTSSFVCKLDENGLLDNNFGIAGFTTIQYLNRDISIYSMGVQSDGKIIVSGFTQASKPGIFTSRLDKNGNLDLSFGQNGFNFYFLDSNLIVGPEMTVLENDEIIIGGTTLGPNSLDLVIVGLTPNGQLNTLFANQGVLILDVNNGSDELTQLLVSKEGGFYAMGYSYSAIKYSLFFKLNADGSLVQSYGNNGRAIVKGNADKVAVLDSQNRLVAVGSAHIDGHNILSVIRLLPNGRQDINFGPNGYANMSFINEYPHANAIHIGPSGKIVVGGYHKGFHNKNTDAMLCRFDSSGRIDSSFSYDGQVVANLTYGYEYPEALIPHSNGNLLVIGSTQSSDGRIFMSSYQMEYALNVQEEVTDEAIIYPNPSTGIVELNIQGSVDALNLISMNGTIFELTFKNSLDLSDFAKGVYILEVRKKGTIKRTRLWLH